MINKEEVLKRFNKNNSLESLVEEFATSKRTLKLLFEKEFGEEAYKEWIKSYKLKEWQDKAISYWETDLILKEIINKVKIAETKLRKFYKEKYGEKAFKDRSKRIKSKSRFNLSNEKIPQLIKRFEEGESLTSLSKDFSISKDSIRRIYIVEKDEVTYNNQLAKNISGAKTNKTWYEEALKNWNFNLSTKEIAKEMGISRNSLKTFYREKFGDEAVIQRGKRIKLLKEKKIVENGALKGRIKKRNYITVNCFKCGKEFEITKIQQAKTKPENLICEDCDFEGYEIITCPVCEKKCKGKKGLASHFSNMKNEGCLEHIKSFEKRKAIQEKRRREEAHTNKSKAAIAGHAKRDQESYEGTKTILCPECNKNEIKISKFASPEKIVRIKCDACKEIEEALLTEGIEGKDYLRCKVEGCGYITKENLFRHLQISHNLTGKEYKEKYDTNCTTPIYGKKIGDWHRGQKRSEKTRKKMSENAGRWNAGLTKENDERVAQIAESIQKTWNDGTREIPELGYQFSKEDLLPYVNSDGKIMLKVASDSLGCCTSVVIRYCYKHELELADTTLVLQNCVLELLKKVLRDFPYIFNATFDILRNPETGYPFIYDGYFGGNLNLLVEVQGYQHFERDNIFHKTAEDFEKMQQRDKVKRQLALEKGFNFLAIRYDDPITEENFLNKVETVLGNINQRLSQDFDLNLPEPSKSGLQRRKQNEYLEKLKEWKDVLE